MLFKKLSELATIDISNVDKKTKTGEQEVKLCNFVDVYHKWALKDSMVGELMSATANENQISRFKLHSGQVAITKDSETKDDIGMAMLVDINMPDVVLGYHCALITPDGNKLSASYLNVVLQSSYASKYFEMNASGSGQRYTLTNDIIGNFPVPMISLKEQESISDVFDQINNKILTNNAIISELEAMAKDIYDYWFVQFDFPDENGKPYKSSGGKMVWNEELKREIPEGWKKSRFDEAFSIVMGSSPSGDSINVNNNGIVFFQGNADFGDKYPSPRTYSTNPIRFANKKDVLLSVRAPVGAINISYEKCCIGRGVAAISSSHPSFAYYTVKNSYPYFDIYNQSGTTFGCIGRDELGAIPCILPPKEVLERFEKTVGPASNNGYNLFIQNNELTSLRDFLLPLLMNGQVKIGDVEL